ncbi:uncharacterized protein KZ484_026507 [Pholidichthys leucotaenia]
MKVVVFLVVLSFGTVGFMVFQTARQEYNLRKMTTGLEESLAQLKQKESAIAEVKVKVVQIKKSVENANSKLEALKKKQEGLQKSPEDLKKNLVTCRREKDDFLKKNTEVTDAITNLKAAQEEARNQAEEEVSRLKQQILDRDKTVCEYADMTKIEARNLCGNPQAAK